jgi:DNA-binding NarL/FixJ family response regulator
MANKTYKALIIDDHPLISEAYKSAFRKIEKDDETISFHINVAHDCDTAYEFIKESFENTEIIDVVFLDISLPPSKDGKIVSGEDLGLKINQLIPNSKIIVSTTFNDNYRVHSIFKNINPEGFLIKNDITPKELVTAINTLISGSLYYSKTVMQMLRLQVSNDFILDDIDRKILYELSLGAKTKELPNIVMLSINAIEKRKRHLKHVFDIKNADDRELIVIAKEKGFI